MIEWPFLFPFAALSENFAYSTFCFLWVWFQFWFWPKFKRERSISKLRFKTFFIERKKLPPFFIFHRLVLYVLVLHSATNCFWNAKKLFEYHILHLFGKYYFHRFWFHLDKKNLSSFFQHFLHIMDTFLSSVFMCVYALN